MAPSPGGPHVLVAAPCAKAEVGCEEEMGGRQFLNGFDGPRLKAGATGTLSCLTICYVMYFLEKQFLEDVTPSLF